MRVWITGITGVLGSALASTLISQGHYVAGNDIVRIDEAWRLKDLGIDDQIQYAWKSTTDLEVRDLLEADVVVDAGLMVADRPFGITSPNFTVENNIKPALHLLETVRHFEEYNITMPVLIYPSSFNALYGLEINTILKDSISPVPNTVYGWTKAGVELLYKVYYESYSIPVIITRVGSAFGPRMRTDELIGHLIIHALKNEAFQLRSPASKRLWTYIGDALQFYTMLFENIEHYIGKTLHCAGNLNREILTNLEIARKIKDLTGSTMEIIPSDYEPGETKGGKPIDFKIEYSNIEWKPKYSLDEGLLDTISWFKNNMWRF